MGRSQDPEGYIHSPRRAFGCFSLRILNDRAAASYQLLDLSLAGLPLDRPFLVADLSSFEVGILVLFFFDNCLPLIINLIQHLSFDSPNFFSHYKNLERLALRISV